MFGGRFALLQADFLFTLENTIEMSYVFGHELDSPAATQA